ncbi:MAG TPA: NUDIX hydrolase [Bdellovibrionota bacterium]|jgi:ADP-ribose pyrophosphatase
MSSWRSMKPWKALSRKVHQHSKYRKILDVLFELPDGRQETYSLAHEGRAVCVLALTPDRQVILARQFRPGPGILVDELPGGAVDEGESWEAAVRRELLEETGFAPQTLIPLGRFLESAYSTIERHGFLALGCERVAGQELDPTEFIEIVLKPLPDFLAQIRAGLCTDCEVAWAALHEAGIVKSTSL